MAEVAEFMFDSAKIGSSEVSVHSIDVDSVMKRMSGVAMLNRQVFVGASISNGTRTCMLMLML